MVDLPSPIYLYSNIFCRSSNNSAHICTRSAILHRRYIPLIQWLVYGIPSFGNRILNFNFQSNNVVFSMGHMFVSSLIVANVSCLFVNVIVSVSLYCLYWPVINPVRIK